MDFFFPEDNLTRAVPEETKIATLSAQPYPDGRRLRVNLEVTLHNADGDEVASTNIVEPMSWKLEFTMHLRGELRNPYTLNARLYYPDGPSAEAPQFSFDVEPPQTPPAADPA